MVIMDKNTLFPIQKIQTIPFLRITSKQFLTYYGSWGKLLITNSPGRTDS